MFCHSMCQIPWLAKYFIESFGMCICGWANGFHLFAVSTCFVGMMKCVTKHSLYKQNSNQMPQFVAFSRYDNRFLLLLLFQSISALIWWWIFQFNWKITLRKIAIIIWTCFKLFPIKHAYISKLSSFSNQWIWWCSWNKLDWKTTKWPTCISQPSACMNHISHPFVQFIIYNKWSMIYLYARLIVWLEPKWKCHIGNFLNKHAFINHVKISVCFERHFD